MNEMSANDEFPRPRMHPVNRVRWRTGSSGRPLTPRRAGALGLLERSVRPDPPADTGPSVTDSAVAESARRAAQHVLGRAGRRGSWSAYRADRITSRATRLRHRVAELRSAVVRGPSGAAEEPAGRAARHDRLATVVGGGEERHRRVGRGHRIAARLLPWVDALLFGYFIAGVSNADLTDPMATPVASLVAVGFTAFLVLTVAVFTPWLGHSLRVHKSPSGQLRFAEIGPVATGLLGLWGVLALAIGATMFVRVRSEAEYAGADPWTGTAVAVLLALAAVAMTGYVLGVAIADGTAVTDELRAVARAVARDDARRRRLERRAHRCDVRRARVVRAAQRRESRALVRAGDGLAAVDRTVDMARLRSGAPADRPRPPHRSVEDLDHRELATIQAHLDAPKE
jgi:hypothetical protein